MALNNIASAQHGLLRLDEALLGYQRAREILEQTLGPQHPDVAAAISNIGLMYQDQGRHEEALTQYQRALEIQQHALGPEHPDVASSLNDIGVVYQLEERYEEALEVHQRALGISERAFGLHFNVLRDLFGVSNAQLALGRPADAVVLLERALELCDAAGASASQRASVGALLDRARKAANRSRARP
jgi:tetratricopeptide (TPR) repeat protein